VIRVSSLANSYPGHMRAPPPNDKKLYGGTDALFWKRSGSNLDACGKILSSICVMLVDNIT